MLFWLDSCFEISLVAVHDVVMKWQQWQQLFCNGLYITDISSSIQECTVQCMQCTICAWCGSCLSQFQICVCVSGLVCLLPVTCSQQVHSVSVSVNSNQVTEQSSRGKSRELSVQKNVCQAVCSYTEQPNNRHENPAMKYRNGSKAAWSNARCHLNQQDLQPWHRPFSL